MSLSLFSGRVPPKMQTFYFLQPIMRKQVTLVLIGTLMLAVTPFVFFHSTIVYANLPMAFYYMASVIYLYQFFQNNNRAFLVLSSALVGIGCWTRPDGLIWASSSCSLCSKKKTMAGSYSLCCSYSDFCSSLECFC